MRNITIRLLSFFLLSCTDASIKVKNLPYVISTFQDLPLKVKEYLIDANSDIYYVEGSFVLINSADSSLYKIEMKKSTTTPWIYQESITNLSFGITYEMETSFPEPFLLYGDTLYIPNQYNVLFQNEKLDKLSFKKFVLENNDE